VRKAMAALMLTESIAEELRIFYVGLTRAKEKLVMTGVTPDVPALVKKYEQIAERKEEQLAFSNVHIARNYLDFVVMSFMRNDVFEKAMGCVRKRMDKKGENIISAQYHRSYTISHPDIRLKVSVFDFENLMVQHLQSDGERQIDRKKMLLQWENAPDLSGEKIRQNLSWEYPHLALTKQKTKMSVTEIKRIYETDYEPSDVVEKMVPDLENYEPPIPRFLSGEKSMSAADKGTWVHKTMELFDFVNVRTLEQVETCLQTMRQEGRIPEKTRQFITAKKIYALLESPLGKRICQAAERGEFYKEKQFVVGVPASRISNGQEEDLVVVQGIVDGYFKEGDDLILLDYKTDRVKPGQENILAKRYETQLRYYRETLEQLTGLKVAETYLYSFALDKEIRVS
jgi:ATP-dependent helicase/nuclease subunit A